MKKYIKIDREKFKQLNEEIAKWRRDYWKANDAFEIFKEKHSGVINTFDMVKLTLEKEIRDLKLILAGAVCKDNPFVDKKDAQMIPVYDQNKLLTL